jgi:hypothetical protein
VDVILGKKGERTFEEDDGSEIEVFGVGEFVQFPEGRLQGCKCE